MEKACGAKDYAGQEGGWEAGPPMTRVRGAALLTGAHMSRAPGTAGPAFARVETNEGSAEAKATDPDLP